MATDHEYKAIVESAFKESWSLINNHDSKWVTSKATTLACDVIDKVEWRPSPRKKTGLQVKEGLHCHKPYQSHIFRFEMRRRIYRVTATMPGKVETVAALLRDVSNSGTWNKAIKV